ncbi:DUF3127 domain-containing protein [Saccharicrinis sp. FJH54]|uniref:DUF3127 domain-containing protein n=1 Tax=Saccharicrinis sp. FJH54 TaxID=3344665 RepID=UPI0035D4B00B
MNFEIEGKLILKEDEQQISASFKKREFVIEVVNERNTEWNDFIKFQLTQDRCNLIDQYNNGDNIKVSFNIRGRKWEKNGQVNYFSNLEAWRIEGAMVQNDPVPADIPPPDTNNIPPENDDLPF